MLFRRWQFCKKNNNKLALFPNFGNLLVPELIIKGWEGLVLANFEELFIGTVRMTHERWNCVVSNQRFVFHGQEASLASLICHARLHSLFLDVWLKVNPIPPWGGGGGGGFWCPHQVWTDNLSFHIIGLFLKCIWQFGDVIEFWLEGLMLPWQQHFEGHV